MMTKTFISTLFKLNKHFVIRNNTRKVGYFNVILRSSASLLMPPLMLLSSSSSSSTFSSSYSSLSVSHLPIVIIGGGPCGLLMSNLLSKYQVPSILLESQTTDSRFRHPQAHFLNTRSMEILKYSLPNVYEQVQRAMPPVNYWKSFRFVTSVSDNDPLAEVIHPVDRPLQAAIDANGILSQDMQKIHSSHTLSPNPSDEKEKFDISPCSVGHLAQHTFCRILYDAAQNNAYDNSKVQYQTRVTGIKENSPNSNLITVQTDHGAVDTNLVVAADGAHSFARNLVNIQMRGKQIIQHLINIHVQLPAPIATKLHENSNHAMLYSVYSEHVLAMVVCHSIGDYIIQIPFFPPFQTFYEDFGPDRIDVLIKAIFGKQISEYTVRSVNPWTMGSLIADHYFDIERKIVLTGDAAHVFPPAGGFGMNTGLQDVHNLAWRLAWLHKTNRFDDLNGLLATYQKERKPVAEQNAALSVRNFERLLEVTKSFYLDNKYPQYLARTLQTSPLPLIAQKAIFKTLLQTALHPLSWLKVKSSSYYRLIQSNLHKILRQGAGLPLLFPDYEINFGYASDQTVTQKDNNWFNDSKASFPVMSVGKLMPHAVIDIISGQSNYPFLAYQSSNTISTRDIASQLMRNSNPAFALCYVANEDLSQEILDILTRVADQVSEKIRLPVEVACIVSGNFIKSVDTPSNMLFLRETGQGYSFSTNHSATAVLIRPDGHIAALSSKLELRTLSSNFSSAAEKAISLTRKEMSSKENESKLYVNVSD